VLSEHLPGPTDDAAVGTLITALAQRPIDGKSWIVERRRIREYLPETDEPMPEPR
jgi:hypothetical protein